MSYTVELYKGKSYSVIFDAKTEQLAEKLGYRKDSPRKEWKVIKGSCAVKLLLPSMKRMLLGKVAKAITELIKNKESGEISKESLTKLIEEVTGEKIYYDWHSSSSFIDSEDIQRFIMDRVSLSSSLYIIPNMRSETSLEQTLHLGRVTGRTVILPIGNHTVLAKEDGSKRSRKWEIIDFNPNNINEECQYVVIKVADLSGKVINLSNSSCGPNGEDLQRYIEMGRVYRDAWAGRVIQMEGILRLQVKHIGSRKVPKPSTKPRKKRYKITLSDVQNIHSWVKHGLAKYIAGTKEASKISSRYGYMLNLTISFNSSYYIGTTHYWTENSIEGRLRETLAIWNYSSKKAKRAILISLKEWWGLEPAIRHIDVWKANENEYVREIAKLLIKASRIKSKGGKDERSDIASSDDTHATESNDNRETAGVIVRTSSGYEGFCRRESSAEDAGGDSHECNGAQ